MQSSVVRVAVTGVGGGAGQSILKALQGSRYEVVGMDGEHHATGLYACRDARVIPYANDPAFIDEVLKACKETGCDILFPGLDAELIPFSAHQSRLEAAGLRVVVSSPEVVEIGDDKLVTYTALKKHGFDVPLTLELAAGPDGYSPLSFPFILKRRKGGARSKDVYLIKSHRDFETTLAKIDDVSSFVAQEYIDGDEYTCGSITLAGKCHGVIVMRRILRDGDTYKCFSVRDSAIEDYVESITNAILPFGSCNVQLRLRDGRPYAFEINARCSGTTAARALCGFNEPRMILDYLYSHIIPDPHVTEKTIMRYWKEFEISQESMTQLSANGRLHQQEFSFL